MYRVSIKISLFFQYCWIRWYWILPFRSVYWHREALKCTSYSLSLLQFRNCVFICSSVAFSYLLQCYVALLISPSMENPGKKELQLLTQPNSLSAENHKEVKALHIRVDLSFLFPVFSLYQVLLSLCVQQLTWGWTLLPQWPTRLLNNCASCCWPKSLITVAFDVASLQLSKGNGCSSAKITLATSQLLCISEVLAMVGQPQLITDFCGFTLFQELCIIFYEPALSPYLSEVTQTAQSDHSLTNHSDLPVSTALWKLSICPLVLQQHNLTGDKIKPIVHPSAKDSLSQFKQCVGWTLSSSGPGIFQLSHVHTFQKRSARDPLRKHNRDL